MQEARVSKCVFVGTAAERMRMIRMCGGSKGETPSLSLLFLIVMMRRVIEELRRVAAHAGERREVLTHEDDERDDDVVRQPVARGLQRQFSRRRGGEARERRRVERGLSNTPA